MTPLLLAIAAPIPAAAFAPPLDVPIRHVQTEIRDDGRNRRSFRLERSLRFFAEPDGYRVLLTTISVDAEAELEDRNRYRDANRGLLGKTITIHLDREGKTKSVDDLPAIWSAWVGGLVAAANSNPATDTVKRLEALSQDQRAAMIGAMVTSSLATLAERTVSPERAVVMGSPPPFAELTLSGTTVTSAIGDRIVTRTTATGASPDGGARISLALTRSADPATGMLTGATRRVTTSARAGHLVQEITQSLTW